MALRKKYPQILALGADIMVIQECSKTDIEERSRSEGWSFWWVGENQNKGLGVLVKSPWIIREAQDLSPKWAGKIVIDGPASIDLFPVWGCKSKNPDIEYIEQVHLLLDMLERVPLSPLTIVAGDFNSNSLWDSGYAKNHSAAVERFRKLGMESAYHLFSGNPPGGERDHPTHWNLKKRDPGYHVDYVFLSESLLPRLKSVEVGRCDDWLCFSDHAPLIVELDL